MGRVFPRLRCVLGTVLVVGLAGGCASTGQKNGGDATVGGSVQSAHADKVLVKKSERKLYLLKNGQPIRTYRVSLGTNPKGHKERSGDNRTPEGLYYLDGRNPGSRFHKALHISYPNANDRIAAASRGVSPGGQVMIHGLGGGGRARDLQDMLQGADWTAGCIAVSNAEIEEIWSYTANGTPIEIQP